MSSGNVGLHKTANMTDLEKKERQNPAAGAVDGQISDGKMDEHCAYLNNADHSASEWWTDLGDVYKIYNITLYTVANSKLY